MANPSTAHSPPPSRLFAGWFTLVAMALFAITACASNGGCASSPDADEPTDEPTDIEEPTDAPAKLETEVDDTVDTEACARAINALAFDLWATLEHGDNAAISPASISTALSMVLAGAGGQTAQELADALHLSTDDDTHHCWAQLLESWQDFDAKDGMDFQVANRLFADQQATLRDDYQRFTERFYGAGLQAMDFRHQPDASRQEINQWVEEVTRERIQDLLPPPAVTPQTDLVLVNAIYLLGEWAHAFNPDRTEEQPFHGADGSSQEVPMMRQTEHVPYADVDGAQIVELPYAHEGLSMIFILPPEDQNLPDLMEDLDAATLDGWLDELSTTEIGLTIPRFQIDAASVDLVDAFSALGVERLFEGDADLSAIMEEQLFVNGIFHQTFVAVDEEGTEAAGATGVAAIRGAAPTPEPTQFRADRPFQFMIRDAHSGAILFLGHVGNP